MAYKNIEDKRAYHRQYMKETRQWLKEHHFCTECKRQDAFTLAGRRYCADCSEKEKARERTPEARQRYCDTAKKRRQERADQGLCANCGRELPKNSKFKSCAVCRAVFRKRGHKRSAAARGHDQPMRVIWANQGLCMVCGAPRMQGEGKWGSPLKVCERCYGNLVAAGQLGREKFLEKNGKTYGQQCSAWERAARIGW